VIFTHTEEQKRLAEASKQALTDSKRFNQPIVVQIAAASDFTPAEDYHQDFYKKNPTHYSRYRTGCARDIRLQQLWGKTATN
jgi:peptide methionine sulfoxide reductase MsrA